MLICLAVVNQSPGFPDQTNAFYNHPDLCTAGSSEVHGLTCHLHCGVSRATTFLLNSTATLVMLRRKVVALGTQTALHGSNVWAGSFLARPEGNLRLPSGATCTVAYQGQSVSLMAQPHIRKTAHHGCDLWAGSGLAGPEAILTLPPAALSTF